MKYDAGVSFNMGYIARTKHARQITPGSIEIVGTWQVIDECMAPSSLMLMDRTKPDVCLSGINFTMSALKPDDIIFGIRPEDIAVERSPSPGAVEAKVRVVEPLGSHKLLTTEVNGEVLKVQVPPDLDMRMGDRVWLKLNLNKLCIFDKSTGKSLRQKIEREFYSTSQ